MHGPVPQASPPQPQVSHSITSAGTPSVARSAAPLWQPHSERGIEPIRSGRSAALPGCQGVPPTRERCFLAARASCGAATNSRHAFLGHFRRFWPIYSHNKPHMNFIIIMSHVIVNLFEQTIDTVNSSTLLSLKRLSFSNTFHHHRPCGAAARGPTAPRGSATDSPACPLSHHSCTTSCAPLKDSGSSHVASSTGQPFHLTRNCVSPRLAAPRSSRMLSTS